MSSEETPSERVVPVTPPVASSGEVVAENYVVNQLQKARVDLQRTRIIGIVLMVFVVGYLSYLTIKLQQELRPETAATTANGLISQQIQDKGPEVAEQAKQKVQAMIAELPDQALAQLPHYRMGLEEQLEKDLQKHCAATADLLGDHLDVFLEDNKDQIKEVLTHGQDPEKMKELGDSLQHQLMAYLKEKPANGESVQEQIDKSLSALHEVEHTMHRLADAKNLTPHERKTRRAIALIAKTADHELKGFSIKEVALDKLPIHLPTGEATSEVATTNDTLPPASGKKLD